MNEVHTEKDTDADVAGITVCSTLAQKKGYRKMDQCIVNFWYLFPGGTSNEVLIFYSKTNVEQC